jgi:hypothetical protein
MLAHSSILPGLALFGIAILVVSLSVILGVSRSCASKRLKKARQPKRMSPDDGDAGQVGSEG